MVGIPYAPSEIIASGLVRICPICKKRIFEPWSEFDEDGEYIGKDSAESIPSPYQMHYMVEHEGKG